MGGTVGLQRPHLHFPEALAAVLGLATEWLLCHETVWARAAGVHLVLDQVQEFQHERNANGHRLVEGFTALAVVEHLLA